MKNVLILFLVLVCSTAQGQILKTTNLNLNSGGVIHDVVYDSYYDAFIVVGDFTSINGQTRNNLAFIDANTYALMSQAPIASINGVIRSVEHYSYFYNHPVLGATTRSYLYLGGDFTLINGYTRNYLSRFLASHVYSQPPAGGLANYSFNPWDAELPVYSSTARDGVHDFLLTGDTLITTGYFSMISTGTSYTTTQWRNLLTIDADATTMTTIPLLENYASNSTESIQGIRKLGSRYFIFGQEGGPNNEFIYELSSSGTIIQDMESCGNETIVHDLELHVSDVDTLLFSFEQYAASAAFSSYELDASLIFCPFNAVGNSIIDLSTIGLNNNFLEVYKNYLLMTDGTGFYSSKRNGQANVPVSGNFQMNANWLSAYPSVNSSPCFKRLDDKLFVSSNNLTNINGSIRNGLAVLCLEPADAKPFTSFDPTACEGDSSIYTIPQAEFADGYRWTYSGTGALYRITGSGDTWVTLSTQNLTGTNTNSIEIQFPIGTTGGILTVEPFSVCNTTTDYQYSTGQNNVISINAVPDIILDLTHVLNCYSDTVHMVAQSTMSNVDYSWTYYGLGVAIENDSVTIAQGLNLADSTFYVVTVDNPITGCFSSDSTYFTTDLVATLIVQSAITTNPVEFTCATDSMTIYSNILGAIVTWENPSQAGTFPDPYVITSVPSGYLTVYATYLSNGCSTQADFGGIIENNTLADGLLVGYPLTGGIPIDTLTCNNPTLSIECDVTAAFASNSTAEWIVGGTPTGSSILNLSQADTTAASPLIFQFRTINNDNGCEQYYNVTVAFDFDQPTYSVHGDETINCSQTEVLLNHILSGSVIEGWLDPSGQQTFSDSLLATTTGEYYYQVQGDNGCMSIDTVQVTQSLDLLIDMPTDTLICPNQVVIIAPSIIGNTETPSFVWSTGSTTPSESATGGIDSQLIVTVSTPSGCSGTDTTTISITAPVDATITPIVGCTDGNLEVTSISGGAGNYQYSLDGSTWQISTNFGGIAFGDYTISVQDDLGCIYDFDQSLDGTASSIEMQFAASTYNQEGDTIVLVNITDFTGLDSVSWVLPVNADVTFEDDSMVILSIIDGGWYDVELIGYLGSNCEYSYTAPVYFGTEAPIFDSAHVSNGIQSFVVNPNPTTGSFNVALEFGTAQNYSILVTNSLGQPIAGMSVNDVGTVVNHSFQFPIGTPAGSYRIHVIADYDAQQKMIILN